ncbi:MAG: hypothetical protein GY851_09830 [bacterium]|nr:hypothetical protein [bacterium]
MNIDRQNRILIGVAVGVILLFAMIYLLGGGAGSVTKPEAAAKPLVAKAGKARDKTLIIERATDEMDTSAFTGGDGASRPKGESDPAQDGVDADAPVEEPLSPEEEAIQEALNAIDPRTGIKRIKEHLASLSNAAQAAQTYTALATLQLQTDPPSLDEALASAALARESASTASDAHGAGLVEARIRVEQGDASGAAEGIDALLDARPEVTVPGLELRVLQGHLAARARDRAGARSHYEQAAADAIGSAPSLGEPALDIYRQACLHLSRSHAMQGRTSEAKGVIREMNRRLTTARAPGAL